MAKSQNYYHNHSSNDSNDSNLNVTEQVNVEEPIIENIQEEPIIETEAPIVEETQLEQVNNESIIEEQKEEKVDVKPINTASSKRTGKIILVLVNRVIVQTEEGFNYTIQGTGKIGDTIEF